MTDPSRVRTSSLTSPRRRVSARQSWTRKLSAAVGTAFFCAGLVLMPALVALDLTVGLACHDLDRAACVALFQAQAE
jgi:hypothetical protein